MVIRRWCGTCVVRTTVIKYKLTLQFQKFGGYLNTSKKLTKQPQRYQGQGIISLSNHKMSYVAEILRGIVCLLTEKWRSVQSLSTQYLR